jgi:hypothetical protein
MLARYGRSRQSAMVVKRRIIQTGSGKGRLAAKIDKLPELLNPKPSY